MDNTNKNIEKNQIFSKKIFFNLDFDDENSKISFHNRHIPIAVFHEEHDRKQKNRKKIERNRVK